MNESCLFLDHDSRIGLGLGDQTSPTLLFGLLRLRLGLRLGLTVFAAPTPASVACSAASRWNRDLGCSFSSSFSGVLFFLIFALPSPKRSWASHGPPPLLRFPLLRRNP